MNPKMGKKAERTGLEAAWNTPTSVVMDIKSSYGDQNYSLKQTINMFISAKEFDLLTRGFKETDLLLEAAPGGQSMNCIFFFLSYR